MHNDSWSRPSDSLTPARFKKYATRYRAGHTLSLGDLGPVWVYCGVMIVTMIIMLVVGG